MMRIHRTGPRVTQLMALQAVSCGIPAVKQDMQDSKVVIQLSYRIYRLSTHKALTFNNLISYCHDQTLVAKDFQAPSTWQLFLRGGPWDLPDAARRPRTCWTLRNTTEMVEMEIGEKHLLIFRILQTSFQYALFCQSVNEYCALIYWYTVLYSFWACNGDEPALLRHRAQLQTGQKGVVDLSVWWSEIFWNIYLGPIRQWSVNSMWILNQCARTV